VSVVEQRSLWCTQNALENGNWRRKGNCLLTFRNCSMQSWWLRWSTISGIRLAENRKVMPKVMATVNDKHQIASRQGSRPREPILLAKDTQISVLSSPRFYSNGRTPLLRYDLQHSHTKQKGNGVLLKLNQHFRSERPVMGTATLPLLSLVPWMANARSAWFVSPPHPVIHRAPDWLGLETPYFAHISPTCRTRPHPLFWSSVRKPTELTDSQNVSNLCGRYV
jgi:hypothetical protein